MCLLALASKWPDPMVSVRVATRRGFFRYPANNHRVGFELSFRLAWPRSCLATVLPGRGSEVFESPGRVEFARRSAAVAPRANPGRADARDAARPERGLPAGLRVTGGKVRPSAGGRRLACRTAWNRAGRAGASMSGSCSGSPPCVRAAVLVTARLGRRKGSTRFRLLDRSTWLHLAPSRAAGAHSARWGWWTLTRMNSHRARVSVPTCP